MPNVPFPEAARFARPVEPAGQGAPAANRLSRRLLWPGLSILLHAGLAAALLVFMPSAARMQASSSPPDALVIELTALPEAAWSPAAKPTPAAKQIPDTAEAPVSAVKPAIAPNPPKPAAAVVPRAAAGSPPASAPRMPPRPAAQPRPTIVAPAPMPAPVTLTGPAQAEIDRRMAEYAARLARHIARHTPRRLSGRGVLVVEFRLDRQGRLQSLRLVKPSGRESLDRAGLETIRAAAPFPPPPAEVPAGRLLFAMPVRFGG